MKPVTLTMKAFGSFAEEQTVDFTAFKGGLYLVVGETGAGKTTIFDAIIFALYGKASGTGRETAMMHSDYVKKSQETEVRLVFEQNGKRYIVKRTIRFPKKRGAAEEYGEAVQQAELSQPDGTAVSGQSAVSKRCEELLGLNADQFRKIVMLAQGEFREFLEADSAKKSDILGKLFDSSEYVRYQNLLSQARARLQDRRKKTREGLEAVMRTGFHRPDGTEEDSLLYLPENPQLTKNLDRLIEAEQQAAEELLARKTAAQQAADGINTQIGAAMGNNRLLDELSDSRRHLQGLQERREETALLQREYEAAEKALHRVRPLTETRDAAQRTVEGTVREIVRLKGEEQRYRAALEDAQRAAAADEADRPHFRALSMEAENLRKSFVRYDVLTERITALQEAEHTAAAVQEGIAQKEEKLRAGQEALAAIRTELAGLESAEADQVRAEGIYNRAKEDNAAFHGKDGIRPAVLALIRKEEALIREEQKLPGLAAEAGAAAERYHRSYRAFIDGQAGLLAADLKEELQKNGSAVCPVCHTAFAGGQPHDFAPLLKGTPTQEDVDLARASFEEKEKERRDCQDDVQSARIRLDAEKKGLLERTQRLLPACGVWEDLASPGCLDAASARLRKAEDEAKKAYDLAVERKDHRDVLNKRSGELAEEADALKRALDAEKEALHVHRNTIAGLREAVNTAREDLPFAAKEDAQARYAELEEVCGAFDTRQKQHREALDQAGAEAARARGELTAKENDLPKQESAKKEAEQALQEALRQNGFADEAACAAALAPAAGTDPERWLKRRAEELNSYQNDCVNTARRIGELEEQTRGMTYTDTDALTAKRRAAEEARDQAEAEGTAQNALLQNHRNVRSRAAAALAELQKTDGAWERLDRLAELAAGASGDGGKLSFERYVMGSIFREVLEMANRRLDIMSGGRYSLVHTTNAGRANAAAGLEIEVLDAATGRQRSANSLSGGESFQVSLSLALGLSDTVQARAGGIGLDTLFIDEGFGALDSGALDNAIKVLTQLTEGSRLVGIISHVDRLEESIPQKLRVWKTGSGSRLRTEF